MSEVKKNRFIKPFIIVVSILILIVLLVYSFYKNNINVADLHTDEYDYIVNINENDNSNKDINNSTDINENVLELLDFVSYDRDLTDVIHVTIPKETIYDNFIDLNSINDNFVDNYGFRINRVGFISDENDTSRVIISLDITYKDLISTFAKLYVNYELIDNNIVIYYKDVDIGNNIPKWLYQSFIPFEQNEEIYRIDVNELNLFKNSAFTLSNIKNIRINEESICFDADFMNTLVGIINDELDLDPSLVEIIDDLIEDISPELIDSIINEKNTDLLDSIIDLYNVFKK